jgi:Protein of unknown function (DUF3060)
MSSTLLRPGRLAAALLGAAVLGLAAPAWAATPAAGHISVSKSGLHRTYSCGNGDTVTVSGNSDKLMFTSTCATVTVSGKADFLTLNRLSKSVTFTSTSKSDYVCWDHGSPAIHNAGEDNVAANCHAKAAAPGK